MECNRGEAERAKEIAERKFNEKDFNGAMKFAQKAQKLFPELDGIEQLIAVIDVLLRGESKIAGENDWYAIMSLSPSDDESTVRKQYRRLILQIHPDKNKTAGANDAFKLVQAAFDVLKDNDKRHIYDQKRKVHVVNWHNVGTGSDMHFKFQAPGNSQKTSRPVPQPFPSTASCREQGVPHFKFQAQGNLQKTTRSAPQPSPSAAGCREQGAPHFKFQAKVNSQKTTRPVPEPYSSTAGSSKQGAPQAPAQPESRPPKPRTASCTGKHASQTSVQPKKRRPEQPVPEPVEATFWTRCTGCRMWFEYSQIFVNRLLLCRSCIVPFYAANAGQPVVRYKFEHMQDWKCNPGSAKWSNGSCNSNQGSSENVSASCGTQQQGRLHKRMRGEASSNATTGSS